MSIIEKKNRLLALAERVRYYSDQYYNKANSEISDAEYDALVSELRILLSEVETVEPNASEITLAKETLDSVGAPPSYGREVKHDSVMGSLDKVTSFEELKDWHTRYSESSDRIIVMPKLDGCSVRLNYKNGVLVQAASRGDGKVGQDVTDNVRAMSSVPNRIDHPGEVEIRGEVIMPLSVFNKLVADGEKGANPRNMGTGRFMAKDPAETARSGLEIVIYDVKIKDGEEFKTESDKLAWMAVNLSQFRLVPSSVGPLSDFEATAVFWESKRSTLDYEIDGLVVALDSLDDQEAAGWHSDKYPRGKIAYKFKPEETTAEVVGIDWQVGRTGKLTPMCRIKPTVLAGSTISNITLHNAARVKELDIAIGDTVLIVKGGDIIPQVVQVTKRPAGRDAYIFEKNCPSCGHPVTMDDKNVSLWCNNPACPAQLERRILHWVKTLNIEGLGPGIVSEICKLGVKDISGLYYLTEDQLISATGSRIIAGKVQKAIFDKSSIPLEVFLDGLGIDGLGTTTSKALAKKFGTIGGVLHACVSDLLVISDIGELTAKKIISGLNGLAPLIDELVKVLDIDVKKTASGPLKGMSFVLTGAMSFPRKEIEAAIEKAGGENKGSVSKGVTYLVQADSNSTSSKTEKAKKVGTKVISEGELWRMIG